MKALSSPRWAVLGMALLTSINSFAQSYQWHKQFTGDSPNLSRFEDMAVDGNGNVYVVGTFSGTINFGGGPVTADFSDFYFAKYNASGALQFFRKIGKQGASAIVRGSGVSLLNSGGNTFLYVSGNVSNTDQVNFDPGQGPAGNLTIGPNGAVFIVKYNVTTNDPTFEWVRGVNKTTDFSNRPKIATDAAGSAYAVAAIASSSSVIIKHNVNGSFQWQKSTTGIARDVAFRSSTSSVVVCGTSMSIANGNAMVRLNANNGNIQATLSDNQHDFWSVAVDNSGNMYVAGYLNGTTAKVQKFGTGTWTKSFSITPNNPINLDLAGPSQNEVIVAGWFRGTVNFNNDINPAFTLASTISNNDDIFAARYSVSSGNCLWVRSYPANQSTGLNLALAVVGRVQNFLIGGLVNYRTIDVDFCQGVANVAADNAQNSFIAQYSLLSSSSVSISGSGIVCTSGTPHTVNAYGGTITWSVSPSSLVVSASGSGSTANLQAKPGVKGQATLTFTFNGAVDDCGMPVSGSINKPLWIGLPNGGIAGPDVVYPQQNYFYENATPSSIDGGFDYQWTIYGGVFNGINYNTAIAFWNETGTIHLDYENLCGRINTIMEVTVTTEGGCNPCTIIQTYPNPASDELNIVFNLDVEDAPDATSVSGNEVALVNSNQRVVYSTVTKANEITINTTELPDGKYFLIVKNKNGTDARQILIKH